MSSLKITDSRKSTATVLPDDFVDYYMPRANGEYVKVYLYLLRCGHAPEKVPSLSAIADIFDCPEKDILRALRYWEKNGILSLTWKKNEDSGEKELTEILFLPLTLGRTQKNIPVENLALAGSAVPAEKKSGEKTPEVSVGQTATPAAGKGNLSGRAAETANSSQGKDTRNTPAKQEKTEISSARFRQIRENRECQEILFVAEQYIRHPISTTDMRRILYFYDTLHFPADLIEYLIEYCVGKGKGSVSYIEKVGLAWHREGIRTVEQAKKETSTTRKEYYTIFRYFGIENRKPIPDEVEEMDRWLKDYGFTLDIIKEAARRTVMQAQSPNFHYAEAILSKWHKSGVKTLEDIRPLDEKHRSETAGRKSSAGSGAAGKEKPTPNRFHNFQQRNTDYNQLEKDLIRRQNRPDKK